MAGFVPPPAVIGALQTLSSVSSDALTLVTLVYVLPAASETPEIVARAAAPHARHDDHPVAGGDRRGRRELQASTRSCCCPRHRWTNCGAAFGVTEFDGAESGPVPTEFVATR